MPRKSDRLPENPEFITVAQAWVAAGKGVAREYSMTPRGRGWEAAVRNYPSAAVRNREPKFVRSPSGFGNVACYDRRRKTISMAIQRCQVAAMIAAVRVWEAIYGTGEAAQKDRADTQARIEQWCREAPQGIRRHYELMIYDQSQCMGTAHFWLDLFDDELEPPRQGRTVGATGVTLAEAFKNALWKWGDGDRNTDGESCERLRLRGLHDRPELQHADSPLKAPSSTICYCTDCKRLCTFDRNT